MSFIILQLLVMSLSAWFGYALCVVIHDIRSNKTK